MFLLHEMTEVVRMPCNLFNKSRVKYITDELRTKFSNKIRIGIGLCITLYDIQEIEDAKIVQGDGAIYNRVKFRYIVFRPLVNEVILGKIRKCTVEGIQVSLYFFEDIFIPSNFLHFPSRYDATEQVWIWEYDAGDGEKHDLYMDPGTIIRFRVVKETFTSIRPTNVKNMYTKRVASEEALSEKKIAYCITGTIDESGLGLLDWWENLDSS